MKLLAILLISVNIFAAEINVVPFTFEVKVNQNDYDVSMDLTLVCRYEKFVISDSSQYEFTYKKVPLQVKRHKNVVTIKNTKNIKHSVNGYFKSNKGCYSISNFVIKSKKYAIGWANKFSTPVELKIYESTNPSKYQRFDAHELIDIVADKEVKFNYEAYANQVNITMEFDGLRYGSMSSYARTTAYRYKDTNRPYKLK